MRFVVLVIPGDRKGCAGREGAEPGVAGEDGQVGCLRTKMRHQLWSVGRHTLVVALLLSSGGCTAIQLLNDTKEVVNPSYDSVFDAKYLKVFTHTETPGRQDIIDYFGVPPMTLICPSGDNIDMYIRPREESQSEGITFRRRAAYAIVFDREGTVKGFASSQSREEYVALTQLVHCVKTAEEPLTCLVPAKGSLRNAWRREANEAFAAAKHCTTPHPYERIDWSAAAFRCAHLFELARTNYEVVEGAEGANVKEVSKAYRDLLVAAGQQDDAEHLGQPGAQRKDGLCDGLL